MSTSNTFSYGVVSTFIPNQFLRVNDSGPSSLTIENPIKAIVAMIVGGTGEPMKMTA